VDFGLSEEQQLLQQTIEGLLRSECPVTRVREVFDQGGGRDDALWAKLAELGLCGLAIPEEAGGAGLGLLELALAAETLGHGAAPGPFLFHALAGLALRLGGSEAQQERWLPRLAAGEALGTVALAEEGGRWQPEEWRLEGGRLSGSKTWVPYAAEADLLVVGVRGGGLALVETAAGGVEAKDAGGVDRTRRLDTVRFDGATAEALPGEDAGARLRDAACVLLAADALGGAWRLVEASVQYANQREQFGVTIGHFQALKHQLAEMALAAEPARALVWYAAHAWDEIPQEAPRVAALAKAHLTDRFMDVARDAVEVHGGIGFTWECDVQIWYKRALLDRAFLGTPAVHRERAAALAGW
jgi:alkylation response protein AidB-like acyl-CoA dehydrogenase